VNWTELGQDRLSGENSLPFMERKGSLLCTQLATGPYPQPDAPSPQPPTYFSNMHSNIILPSTPR